MSAPQLALRGTATTAIGGKPVRVPVCACGELLIGGTDGTGRRCRNRHCGAWYPARMIEAAMTAADAVQPKEAA